MHIRVRLFATQRELSSPTLNGLHVDGRSAFNSALAILGLLASALPTLVKLVGLLGDRKEAQ